MAKVAVRTAEQARQLESGAREYFGEGHSIRLRSERLASGERLSLGSAAVDRMIYVQAGEVAVGACTLPAGSAIILERGSAAAVEGAAQASSLLVFEAGSPSTNQRPGGHVHLLPGDRVPGIANLSASGVSGAIFADGACPTCEVWLHENRFPPMREAPADRQAGVHSHEEDEIIFITAGQMRLGQKLVGPGTAIAIAADTLYSFLPGPEGLTFINFRAGRPGLIHFADGRTVDEIAVWRGTDRPLEYIAG